MRRIRFDHLLQREGWQHDVTVSLDESGTILSLEENGDSEETVTGWTIPGFQNAHSHAFQYAMAGLAEIHPDPTAQDDFWSWRETMYNIALTIGPDELEAIATMLYAEMVRHGYTSVAEFHYLHHDPTGKSYSNLSELGERLISAAKTAGINITLLPMFYQKGGFGVEANEKQRRFLSPKREDYLKLLEATRDSTQHYSGANYGMGIHSLRAVAPEDVVSVLNSPDDIPIHIHISEQLKEVEDCLAFHGQRPVEWLANNLSLTDQYHLVHATHLSDGEVSSIATSGANVVICPSTEGNLGDGLFPLRHFQEVGGKWSIGTDSHIGLSPMEEIRILDYGQRLTTHSRNQMTSPKNGDSGQYAFDQALIAGRKAMNNCDDTYFAVGSNLDAVVLDEMSPLLMSCKPENIMSTFIYGGDPSYIKGTITAGSWVVQNGTHVNKEMIAASFRDVIKKLNIR